MSEDQPKLFDDGENWNEAWQGMPEFIQEDLGPFKTIYVHFESREDMEKFSKLTGQKIGMDTRSIWFPEATIERYANKRYIDAEPEVVEDEEE